MKSPDQVAQDLFKKWQEEDTPENELNYLGELAYYDGADKVILSTEIDKKIEELENEDRYYTGNARIDRITDGFRSNQLIALSAPTKAGKTQFCVFLAKSMPNPTMFLMEESAPEVLYKYKKKGLDLPRFYTLEEMDETSVEYIYQKMLESMVKYDSKIFFIDHLHYLIPDEGSQLMTYKIKKVVQDLKRFAKRHGLTIFLVAHISHTHFDEPPALTDIRDSSFIIQYADTTIMLWRETFNPGLQRHKKLYQYTNNLLVNIALNRKINFTHDDGNTGLVDLTFNTDTWSYDDSEWYTEWIEELENNNQSNRERLQTV